MARTRMAVAVIGCLAMVAACSQEPDVAVAFDTPPEPTVEAQPSPSPTPEPSPTPTPVPTAEPINEGALLYSLPGGHGLLSADGTATVLADSADLDWVDVWPDGRVAGIRGRELLVWTEGDEPQAVPCACVFAFPLDQDVFGVTRSGDVSRFGTGLARDSDEVWSASIGSTGPNDFLRWVGTSYGGDVVLVSGAETATVDLVAADGSVEELLLVEGYAAEVPPRLGPNGQQLSLVVEDPAAPCDGTHDVVVADLVTGEATPIDEVWPELPDGGMAASVQVTSMSWAGDTLFVNAVVHQQLPVDGATDEPGEQCAAWSPALFAFDGSQWSLADSGPVVSATPLNGSAKAYVVPDESNTELAPGSGTLFWERGQESVEVAGSTAVVASAPSTVVGDLVATTPLTASASATRASLLLAAQTGSPRNIAEAAGGGFGFSFDPDLLADPTADPVEFWEGQAECCEFRIAVVVDQLLRVAPLQVLDIDGAVVFEWREPDPDGWRIGIDASGATRWIITGAP